MFKFTFSLGTGTSNPFTAQAEERERVQQAFAPQTIRRKLPPPPKRPLPPPSESSDVPLSRKRGWVPSSSSASQPMSQPTLTTGWIDSPAKYLEQASHSHDGGEDTDADLPPAKRRKTLTDSIISTAFSAALIGTAVGMTAYRMWRDRGKPADEHKPAKMGQPPPPYQKEEWVDVQPSMQPKDATANWSPRLSKKSRSAARRVARPRRTPITISPVRSPSHGASPLGSVPPPQEEPRDDPGELEDQMDWMGDKIRHLIQEGQKALGKEIVVMNDEQDNDEGAVDDGMEGWEEEDPYAIGPSSVASSSFSQTRRQTPKHLAISTSGSSFTPSSFPLSVSHSNAPTSPRSTRSRTTAGSSHSQTHSGSRSPLLGAPYASRLGTRMPPSAEDIKVIYEPGAISDYFHPETRNIFEDEDSRQLTAGLDAVRKAYNIH